MPLTASSSDDLYTTCKIWMLKHGHYAEFSLLVCDDVYFKKIVTTGTCLRRSCLPYILATVPVRTHRADRL